MAFPMPTRCLTPETPDSDLGGIREYRADSRVSREEPRKFSAK